MKISVEEVSRLLAAPPTERQHARPAAHPAQDHSSEGREAALLELSDAAREVQMVKRQLAETPDIRVDRVAALKARVEAGTYNVSGEDIADLIIRRALADNTAL